MKTTDGSYKLSFDITNINYISLTINVSTLSAGISTFQIPNV